MTTKTKKPTASAAKKFDYKKIKTFEDACKKLGIEPAKLPDPNGIPEEFHKPIIAGYKLMIVYKAINNSWRPDWSNWSQYKYYPWFRVLSSGFGFSSTACVCGHAGANVGSRLCFESEEKAEFAGRQFTDLYKEFLILTN